MNSLSPVLVSVLPLIGLMMGWLLNEFSTSRKLRAESRRPFGRALSHLLEAHHYLFLYEAFRRMGAKADSELAKTMLKGAKFGIHEVKPPREGFEQRYTEAVDQIAEISPLLAFELRNKIEIKAIYQNLRAGFGSKSKEGDDLAEVLGDIVVKRALPIYEELLLELAKYFGREERQRLRWHFEEGRKRLASTLVLPS